MVNRLGLIVLILLSMVALKAVAVTEWNNPSESRKVIPLHIEFDEQTRVQTDSVPLIDVQDLVRRIQADYKRPQKEIEVIATAILDAASIFNIPWEILASIAAVESSFDYKAKSSVGALGVMQVLPEYWGDMEYDLQDPYENVLAGASVLQMYKGQCGSWDCALKAYNVGITNYRRNQKKGAQERYIRKIRVAQVYFND